MDEIKSKIRDIADFPEPGILFKDITPLMQSPVLLRQAVELMVAPYRNSQIKSVAAMEARGFIFGSLAASMLGAGFIPLRKPGKLPHRTHKVEYQLEYGENSLEIHADAVAENDNILIVDDVLATGGTAKASCELIQLLGGNVVACVFLMELMTLNGRSRLADFPVHSVIQY